MTISGLVLNRDSNPCEGQCDYTLVTLLDLEHSVDYVDIYVLYFYMRTSRNKLKKLSEKLRHCYMLSDVYYELTLII